MRALTNRGLVNLSTYLYYKYDRLESWATIYRVPKTSGETRTISDLVGLFRRSRLTDFTNLSYHIIQNFRHISIATMKDMLHFTLTPNAHLHPSNTHHIKNLNPISLLIVILQPGLRLHWSSMCRPISTPHSCLPLRLRLRLRLHVRSVPMPIPMSTLHAYAPRGCGERQRECACVRVRRSTAYVGEGCRHTYIYTHVHICTISRGRVQG